MHGDILLFSVVCVCVCVSAMFTRVQNVSLNFKIVFFECILFRNFSMLIHFVIQNIYLRTLCIGSALIRVLSVAENRVTML